MLQLKSYDCRNGGKDVECLSRVGHRCSSSFIGAWSGLEVGSESETWDVTVKSGSECWMIGTVADLESACQDEADPPASLQSPVLESSVNLQPPPSGHRIRTSDDQQ